MRSQRRAGQTVTLVHVTTTTSPVGDETDERSNQMILGAIFEPERTLERTDPDQAPILQPAAFNLPAALVVDSDDLIVEGDVDSEDFDEATAVTWQVIGRGLIWLDRTKVPVQRVGAV